MDVKGSRVAVLFWIWGLLSCQTHSSPQLALKTFNLEELVPLTPAFYPNRLKVRWVSDAEYMYTEPGVGIRKYNADTDSHSTILNITDLSAIGDYSIDTFSEDGKYVLLTANSRKVYRYSSIAEYYVYDLQNRLIVNISPEPLQAVVWGTAHCLAYVKDNNVYYLPDASRPDQLTALTNEGVPGEVYFGVPDWIYEEEVFNAAEALWWSPNATYLAVASFNDTLVESATYPYYGNSLDFNNQYPKLISFKYPKAGRANPVVGLRIFKVNDPTSDAWSIPAPVSAVGTDHILGAVSWATDQNLLVLWLNRRQNISVLINCDIVADKCSIIKDRTEPSGWIDITEPFFDKNGAGMVAIEPSFFGGRRLMHATRFDFHDLTISDLTPINSTVTEVVGWDSVKKLLYFIVAPSEVPWQRQLWVLRKETLQCLSCRQPSCGHASAVFSPGASNGVLVCSAANKPQKAYLYSSQRDTFKLILDNKALSDKLSQYKLPMVLFNTIPLADGVSANVKLMLPLDLKKDQKYPMVVRVYAGPGTTRVKDNYDLEYYGTYLASNRSYIVASIDVRGSGAMDVDSMFAVNTALGSVEVADTLAAIRHEYYAEYYGTYLASNRSYIVESIDVRGSGAMDVDFMFAVNTALGSVEVSDTLAAIRSLLIMYSFIDPARVGVWGWSYGGYVTTMMLIQDHYKVVSCGIAVAPVTSWLYYDSIYTERYMGTPEDNPIGYQRSDVMLQAERLRGRKFLLVHGTGDDNVHYQHSLQLAKELQHADIEFEQMSYTDERHSLLGVSRHFYHTLDRFWTQCFNKKS